MPQASHAGASMPSRGEKRRVAILKAAIEVFLSQGFAAATLDEVIRRSGGSRSTLYEEFGGKEGLFAALIARLCEDIVAALPALDGEDRSPPEPALFAFGRRFLGMMLTPLSLGLYRVVVGEGARFPDLGRAVFAAGPELAATRLSAYLRNATGAGALAVPDPDLAARHFLEMVKGDLHFRALLGEPLSDAEVDACVLGAVRTFLVGVAPRPA